MKLRIIYLILGLLLIIRLTVSKGLKSKSRQKLHNGGSEMLNNGQPNMNQPEISEPNNQISQVQSSDPQTVVDQAENELFKSNLDACYVHLEQARKLIDSQAQPVKQTLELRIKKIAQKLHTVLINNIDLSTKQSQRSNSAQSFIDSIKLKAANVNFDENISNIIQIIKQNGGSLTDKVTEKNMCLQANQEIKEKETILILKKEMLITPLSDKVQAYCSKLKSIREIEKNFNKVCLAVYALKNIQDNDIQSAYFNNMILLPNYYNTYNNQMSTSQVSSMAILDLIRAKKEQFQAEFDLVEPLIEESAFDLEQYINSRLSVLKNTLILEDSELSQGFLAPITELLLNFKEFNNPNTSFRLTSNGDFEIYATKIIKIQEQLSLGIGQLSNLSMLAQYGVTLENNPNHFNIIINDNKEEYELNKEMNLAEVIDKVIQPASLSNKNITLKLENTVLTKLSSLLYQRLNSLPGIQETKRMLKESNESFSKNMLRIVVEDQRLSLKYYNMIRVFSSIIKEAIKPKQNLEPRILSKNMTKILKSKTYFITFLNYLNSKHKLGIQLWSKNSTAKDDYHPLKNSIELPIEEDDDETLSVIDPINDK